jgi:hypothetical protein
MSANHWQAQASVGVTQQFLLFYAHLVASRLALSNTDFMNHQSQILGAASDFERNAK